MYEVKVYKVGRTNKLICAHTFGSEQAARDYVRCYKPQFGYYTSVRTLQLPPLLFPPEND